MPVWASSLPFVAHPTRPTVSISRWLGHKSRASRSITHEDIGTNVQLSLDRHVRNDCVEDVHAVMQATTWTLSPFSRSLPGFVLSPPLDSVPRQNRRRATALPAVGALFCPLRSTPPRREMSGLCGWNHMTSRLSQEIVTWYVVILSAT